MFSILKKLFKQLMIVLTIFIFIWIVLTIWVEKEGSSRKLEMGNSNASQSTLIIYDPDPFYNLDQQVCESFGKGLADNGWKVTIATVVAAKK